MDSHTVYFSAHISHANDCQWLIEIQYENKYIERFVSGTDGENILTVALYKPEHAKSLAGYAQVEKATIPRGDESLPLSAIWLALSAPCYLDRIEGSMINPPYFKDLVPDHLGYNPLVEFTVDRMENRPGFVRSMEFMHDGMGINPGRERVSLPRPFRDGFTNGTFAVTRFAEGDFPGGLYPAEFRLDHYYPMAVRPGSRSTRLYRTHSFQGLVTSVQQRVEAKRIFPELPPGTIAYLDRRFMNPETPNLRVNYNSDRYLTDNEVRALPEFAAALARDAALREPVRMGKNTPGIWTMIIIALLILGPMAIWIFKSKQRTNKGAH